jgi:hypothetical protein
MLDVGELKELMFTYREILEMGAYHHAQTRLLTNISKLSREIDSMTACCSCSCSAAPMPAWSVWDRAAFMAPVRTAIEIVTLRGAGQDLVAEAASVAAMIGRALHVGLRRVFSGDARDMLPADAAFVAQETTLAQTRLRQVIDVLRGVYPASQHIACFRAASDRYHTSLLAHLEAHSANVIASSSSSSDAANTDTNASTTSLAYGCGQAHATRHAVGSAVDEVVVWIPHGDEGLKELVATLAAETAASAASAETAEAAETAETTASARAVGSPEVRRTRPRLDRRAASALPPRKRPAVSDAAAHRTHKHTRQRRTSDVVWKDQLAGVGGTGTVGTGDTLTCLESLSASSSCSSPYVAPVLQLAGREVTPDGDDAVELVLLDRASDGRVDALDEAGQLRHDVGDVADVAAVWNPSVASVAGRAAPRPRWQTNGDGTWYSPPGHCVC